MISSRFVILWREGLHLRAAASLVRLAGAFQSTIRLRADDRFADAVNIMQLMLLSASQGTTLTVEADGPDEAEAIRAVSEFFADGGVSDAAGAAFAGEMDAVKPAAASGAFPLGPLPSTRWKPAER